MIDDIDDHGGPAAGGLINRGNPLLIKEHPGLPGSRAPRRPDCHSTSPLFVIVALWKTRPVAADVDQRAGAGVEDGPGHVHAARV